MTSPTAKPSSAPAKGEADASAKAPAAKQKKKGGCLRGCFLFFVVLLLLAGVVAAVVFDLPAKLHIVKSPAERLFSGTPYREEAAQMKEELQASGMDTKGVELDVLPVTGSDQTVAIATLDASQGFRFTSGSGSVADTFVKLATGDTAKDLNVGRAAIGYKDGKGRKLITVTAPTDAIADYAAGRITKEQFYARVDGKIDIPNVTAAIQEELNSSGVKP